MDQNHKETVASKRKSEQHPTEPTFESSIMSPQSDNPNKKHLIHPSLNPSSTRRVQQGSSDTQPSSTILPIRLGEQPPHPKKPICNVESALSPRSMRVSIDFMTKRRNDFLSGKRTVIPL